MSTHLFDWTCTRCDSTNACFEFCSESGPSYECYDCDWFDSCEPSKEGET